MTAEQIARRIAKQIPKELRIRPIPKTFHKFRCATCLGPVRKAFHCAASVLEK